MSSIIFPYLNYKGNACPIIPLEVKGISGWTKAWAYVDSGASFSVFSIREAEKFGIAYSKGKRNFITVGDGGAIPVYLHIRPFKIGSVIFKATIGFSPKLGVGFNLLGRKDIFNRFDITFSDSSKRLIFLPRC
jgi:hypothetical protein